MANEHTRLLFDPDTGETIQVVLGDDDAARASVDGKFLKEIIQGARLATQHKETDLVTLKTKAAVAPINEEKLLASLPDDALRSIIVNLWARLAYLEKLQGVDHEKKAVKEAKAKP